VKLIPLGINGYLPINGRHSSCFLALFDDAAFLLDAGTGAARLHQPDIQAALQPYDDLHVLLSHYHVDHTAGLYYAFTAWRKGSLHIHAPVCPYMPANPEEAIGRYFSPPLNSYRLEDTNIKIHPLNRPESTIASHRINIWSQQHPGGSIGIRIDNILGYVTDTVVMMENVSHVEGVSCLLHELWLNDEDASAQEMENKRHACFSPVARFVRAARPKQVMPVHLYPHYSDESLSRMVGELQQISGIRAELPVEGRIYTIS